MLPLRTLDHVRTAAAALLTKAGIDSALLDADVLLAHVLGRDRAYLVSHGKDVVALPVLRRFRQAVERRVRHEPVAYITGTKEFYGMEFVVNRHVLIPRPKTEAMVGKAAGVLRDGRWAMRDTLVIDVGTGSGILAITVKKLFPQATVLAIDHSKRALRVAKGNAGRHGFQAVSDGPWAMGDGHTVHFLHSDLLFKVWEVPFHNILVLANLPYIPTDEIATLDPDVKDHEPGKALDGGGDGLDLFRRLAKQVRRKFVGQRVKVLWECEEEQEEAMREMFHPFTA